MNSILESMTNRHITLVALGDSNTEINWWTHGALNWVGLLSCNLYERFRHGKTVINSGVGGSSVPHSLERLERDVILFKLDIVVVPPGINGSQNCDPDGFESGYRNLLEKLLKNGCFVITRTPQPVINMYDGSEVREMEQAGHRRITFMVKEYAERIVRVSCDLNCPCVDHYSSWNRSMNTRYKGEMVMLMA